LQLQLNRCLCRPPCFPYKKLGWFCVRLVYTSFLYKKLGSSVRSLTKIPVRDDILLTDPGHGYEVRNSIKYEQHQKLKATYILEISFYSTVLCRKYILITHYKLHCNYWRITSTVHHILKRYILRYYGNRKHQSTKVPLFCLAISRTWKIMLFVQTKNLNLQTTNKFYILVKLCLYLCFCAAYVFVTAFLLSSLT